MSSVVNEVLHRSCGVRPSWGGLSSQRWLFQEFETHYQDKVVLSDAVTGAEFSQEGLHGYLLAVSNDGGSVSLFDTRKLLSESLISEMTCHKNAIFDISWVTGGSKLLTGSGDQRVRLWDVVTGASLGEFFSHAGSVKAVHSKKDEPSMFVSSCRDGLICVWDTRCSSGHRPANTISSGHILAGDGPPPQKKRRSAVNASVTDVRFHGDNKIASAGGGDGLVKLWDTRKYYSTNKIPKPWLTFDPALTKGRLHGFTRLTADTHQSSLFATCTDNIIYQYNSTGLITRPVGTFSGCEVNFFVTSALSPDNKFLLSGSSCGNAFMWEVDHPESPPLVLPSDSPEVTAVAWCPSLDQVVTTTISSTGHLWRLLRGKAKHTWGVTRCEEYTGPGHLRAQQVLKENVPPQTSPLSRCSPPTLYISPAVQRSPASPRHLQCAPTSPYTLHTSSAALHTSSAALHVSAVQQHSPASPSTPVHHTRKRQSRLKSYFPRAN